jgi:hypothetical protein
MLYQLSYTRRGQPHIVSKPVALARADPLKPAYPVSALISPEETVMATPAAPATRPPLPGTTDSVGITDRDRFFFDLNGFLILRGAIDADHLRQINDKLDELTTMDPPLKTGEWVGAVHAHTYTGNEGINLQQIYEAGEPFEWLIDNPAWIEKVKTFVGGQNTFDANTARCSSMRTSPASAAPARRSACTPAGIR